MAIYHMAMILKIEIMVVSVLYSLHNEIIHMHVYPVRWENGIRNIFLIPLIWEEKPSMYMLTSAPIGALEVKLVLMKLWQTNGPAKRQNGSKGSFISDNQCVRSPDLPADIRRTRNFAWRIHSSEIHRAVSHITGNRRVKGETFKSPEHVF